MPEARVQNSAFQKTVESGKLSESGVASERRILVYRIGSIGDTVITLPALWAIRRHFPTAHMAFLGNATENSSMVLARSVLPAEGLFDQWLTYPSGSGRTRPSTSMLRLFRDLRKEKFDTLVYLAPRGRSGLQIKRDIAFFYGAGIRTFIGHYGIDPLPVKRENEAQPEVEHEADNLLRRLELSQIPVPDRGHRRIDLAISESEAEFVRGWLSEKCSDAFEEQRLVGIAPGSNWHSKTWPEERFAELGYRLISRLGLFPLLLGGPEDVERNERLLRLWGTGVNTAGQLNVRHGAAALAHCRLFVGNDTGTMHLAAAVDTACVVTFSAQDWPGRWYPYGSGHTVLRNEVPCAGCMLRVCDRDILCLKLITVDEVFKACELTLALRGNAGGSPAMSAKREE